MHVAGADVVPLADVPLLEDRAGGQDDVGVRRLAFLPDRLVDDELQALVLVHALTQRFALTMRAEDALPYL